MKDKSAKDLMLATLALLAAGFLFSLLPASSAFLWLYVIVSESGWRAVLSPAPLHFWPFVIFPALQMIGLFLCIRWFRHKQNLKLTVLFSCQLIAVIGIVGWMAFL